MSPWIEGLGAVLTTFVCMEVLSLGNSFAAQSRVESPPLSSVDFLNNFIQRSACMHLLLNGGHSWFRTSDLMNVDHALYP